MPTEQGNYNEAFNTSAKNSDSKKDKRNVDNQEKKAARLLEIKAASLEKEAAKLEKEEAERTPELKNIFLEDEKENQVSFVENPMRKAKLDAQKSNPQAEINHSKEEAALHAAQNENSAAITIQKFGKAIITKNKQLATESANKAALKQIATEASHAVSEKETQKEIKLSAEKELALKAAKLAAEKEELAKKAEPTKGKAVNAYLSNLNKGKENEPNMTNALNQAQKPANSLANSGTKETSKETINTGMSVKDRMKAFQRS